MFWIFQLLEKDVSIFQWKSFSPLSIFKLYLVHLSNVIGQQSFHIYETLASLILFCVFISKLKKTRVWENNGRAIRKKWWYKKEIYCSDILNRAVINKWKWKQCVYMCSGSLRAKISFHFKIIKIINQGVTLLYPLVF